MQPTDTSSLHNHVLSDMQRCDAALITMNTITMNVHIMKEHHASAHNLIYYPTRAYAARDIKSNRVSTKVTGSQDQGN